MNKKLIFILALFLPAIIGGIWLLTATGDGFTPENVSTVAIVAPDGERIEYTKDDKEFFLDFVDNIVAIEKQTLDESVHSVYELHFEKVTGDVVYYLCLNADVKNCLAFDALGNWYRIQKEYAKEFLLLNDASNVYRNSSVPVLSFTNGDALFTIKSNDASWWYLLADESFCHVENDASDGNQESISVLANDGFDFDFDVAPDWYNIKIYDDTALIYDGLLDDAVPFSYDKEGDLSAVITAEWYKESSPLYYGEASYTVNFFYDKRAEYKISDEKVTAGGAVYVTITNALGETLDVTTDIEGAERLTPREYKDGYLLLVPVPMNTKSREYTISVKTERNAISIPLTVTEKTISAVNVSFVHSEGATEYDNALSAFSNETATAFDIVDTTGAWFNGVSSPVKKFINGAEQYWVSSPSYSNKMKIDGTVLENQNFGIHYVKSVAVDALPMYSIADGTVAFSGTTTAFGNTVIIEHGFGFKSVYGHLDTLSLSVGDRVEAGAILGNADPQGFSISRTEAFFAINIDGVYLNPYFSITEPKKDGDTDVSDPIEFLNKLS